MQLIGLNGSYNKMSMIAACGSAFAGFSVERTLTGAMARIRLLVCMMRAGLVSFRSIDRFDGMVALTRAQSQRRGRMRNASEENCNGQ